MKPAALLALATLLGGCAARPDVREVNRQLAADRQQQQEFHQRYARYEVRQDALPALSKRDFQLTGRTLTLERSAGLSLRLTLGARRAVTTNARYRTSSHYRLLDVHGLALATAESTLATEDVPFDGSQSLRLLSDPAHREYLIAEQQSWATFRYIVFRPGAAGWSVAYVDIPRRPSAFGIPDGLPHLLGLAEGKVFLEESGRIYGIPLEALERVAGLAYGIG